MTLLRRLSAWLDVRPHEVRNVTLSFLGAFLVIAFLILARSLREALYLTAFDVETLPYVIAAVAIASVPAVGFFARLLTRYSPKQVLFGLIALLSAGLLVLWPLATRHPPAVVAFYLWTALGTLLLTSGFWVVTSEYYPVRGAKRLFGLIGAGGTLGAMVMGSSLVWLTRQVDLALLIPGLVLLLILFLVSQWPLPKLAESAAVEAPSGSRSKMRDSLTLTWRSPHLRTLAMIVFTVTLATTLLDYQFKEMAQAELTTGEQLASFFGAFYGWTGAIALVLQLALVSRLLALAGVAGTLAVLPAVLLLGGLGLLVAPGLILVTAVRGADNSLRKSIYRSALEVLHVPVPTLLRRKTKTFIDSVVDAVAEGSSAALILLWVTLPGLPSRYLSAFIIVFCAILLVLSRRMGRQYLNTVTQQLRATGEEADLLATGAPLEGRDLLSGTFTRLDIQALLAEEPPSDAEGEPEPEAATAPQVEGILAGLGSPNPHVVARTLRANQEWDETHVPALTQLLARDTLLEEAVRAIVAIGEPAVPHLARTLRDESSDFVIRRRIPQVLAHMSGADVNAALLTAIQANRFEVRYRAAISLMRQRARGHFQAGPEARQLIWGAIRVEVGRDRPVWELQRLLDDDSESSDLVLRRLGVRGELSLEHTFRLLSLVLEPEVVRAAFQGVILDDEKLKGYSLEYLEQVIPGDIRQRLWPFIGDVSELKREKALRPLDDVVSDLMKSGATLFADEEHRAALKRILGEQDD